MAALLPKASVSPRTSDRTLADKSYLRTNRLIRYSQNPTPSNKQQETEPDNALLKLAWYGSEVLGIAASIFRPPLPSMPEESTPLAVDESGVADRAAVVATIKQDFERCYFVTGN